MKKLLFIAVFGFSLNTPASQGISLEPVKSPTDQKNYRYIELDNKLKVLLVSDETADKSAASLDVYRGNGSDPDGWEGLAHFLEHMLFLGTEKYPRVSEYQEFIRSHGGSQNAYTSFAHTNYYFTVGNDYLENALDRFSQFFIAPAFDEVYVDRERSIIESEYQARKKDEHRRLWDARKKWLNASHPASRFSVGSMHTLRDRKGMSAREKLIEFYDGNYSSNIMALAIIGRESLDELENLAKKYFSPIKNKNLEPQRFEQIYMNPDLAGTRLNSVPKKDQNSISFIFPVPATVHEYHSKPLRYIAHLVGHEGEGSLFYTLKSLGWAEGLSAGPGYMDEVQGQFSVRIQLTNEGLRHIQEIGRMLFELIHLISSDGVETWRFEEQKNLAETAFRFARERDPGRVVQSLSSAMHLYEPADLLQGAYLIDRFDPERIRALLTRLNPNNVYLNVISRRVSTDKITEHYDVEYGIEKIPGEWIESWNSVSGETDLRLPEANPFIPERLALLTHDDPPEIPRMIDTGSDIQLWYRPDNEFGAPRANFFISILSPTANSSARNLLLTEFYVRLVNNQLNKTAYSAYLSDLNYSLHRHGKGITLKLSGFEDKQSALLNIIVDAMSNPSFDPQQFEITRDRLIRELNNVSLDSPSNQSIHEIYRLIMRPYWSEEERLAIINSIDFEDVEIFSDRLFKNVKVNILSHGDVSPGASLSRLKIAAELFKNSAFVASVPEIEIRVLGHTSRYLRTKNIAHPDAALAWYFQGREDSVAERAKMSLLKNLLESSFYTDLRTNNRAGYLVHSGVITIDDTPGLLFSVQSATHSAVEIKKLYDNFIEKFSRHLEQMKQIEFHTAKAGLLVKIRQQDKNLEQRSDRYWREIDKGEFNFDSREKFDRAVSELSLNDIRSYFVKVISDRGAELAVQIAGSRNTDSDLIGADGAEFLKTGDAAEFRLNTY